MPGLRTAASALGIPRLMAVLRIPRLTLRSQLTLLYAGFFLAAAIAALAIPIFTIRTSLPAGATASTIALVKASARDQVIRAAVTLTALVAVSLPVGWLIAGRFLRPLRTISATARDISASNLNRRLDPGARDNEFAELGETLNGLFGRLEASFESQRRFVANASHELRTPLSAGRALLQVALTDPDPTVESFRATSEELLALGDQQERLIKALLTLACSERGVARWEPFDLAEIVGKVILDCQHDAQRRNIRIDAALSAAPATGDPSLAESLVVNLVDNAIRHNLAGGHVEIATTMTTGRAVVSVSNTGQLIPPDQIDRLFQPFQRLGSERIQNARGYGLGLAIVRAIAGAHSATLTANAHREGGLHIEVSFPRQAQPAPLPDPSAARRA
jgi:signal transduction histidine kinase